MLRRRKNNESWTYFSGTPLDFFLSATISDQWKNAREKKKENKKTMFVLSSVEKFQNSSHHLSSERGKNRVIGNFLGIFWSISSEKKVVLLDEKKTHTCVYVHVNTSIHFTWQFWLASSRNANVDKGKKRRGQNNWHSHNPGPSVLIGL